MGEKPHIPRIPHFFFKWYCRADKYEELHGDLEEFFYERVEEKGIFKAKLFYLWDVVRCFQPYAWKIAEEPQSHTNSNIGMIKNFYLTAMRNLLKHRSYFLINIAGLAVGIASFIFISLYVINELSYDRFHRQCRHIYRVSSKATINAQTNNTATTNSPVAKALLNEYPEVSNAARVIKSGPLLIRNGGRRFNEEGVLYGDSTLFDVFDFKLLQGNPRSALAHPKSMVLSESYAKKYFGDEDPMGQKLLVEEDTTFYTVTGIFQDIPANSHLQFDMMGSMTTKPYWNSNHWIGPGFHTYIVMKEDTDAGGLEEKIQSLVHKYLAAEIEYYTGQSMAEWKASGNSVTYKLVPLADIHLYSNYSDELTAVGNISYIYMYALIAFIILSIAIFNFVNLATAQSATRAKEVGVRKVMGSSKRSLVFQFMLESVIISLLATFLAAVLVSILTPYFESLAGKQLAFSLFSSVPGTLALLVLGILTGLLGGVYPSVILAKFKPSEVLKGKLSTGAKSGWLRNFLVTLQFAASIVIIIGTLVIYRQIDFMLSKNLGFEKDQLLVIKRPDGLKSNLEAFKNDLLENSNIKAVVNTKTLPGKAYEIRSYRKTEVPETFIFKNNQVTYEYADLLGLEMASGRFFDEQYRSDSNALVINEAAAKVLGFEDPVGQTLTSPWKSGQPITIIGVVKDYHIGSLHTAVEPVSLELSPGNLEGFISVKMSTLENVRNTVAYVEDVWAQHAAGRPFQYFFYENEYENLYRSESATGRVFTVFATLSIFIACLGLIGLISYTASVRRKEIGIRKVLGAGTVALLKVLTGDIAKLLLLAIAVSWPGAYFASDYWLQNFSERNEPGLWIYAVSTLALVFVGGFAISFQILKASAANPVESLRQE